MHAYKKYINNKMVTFKRKKKTLQKKKKILHYKKKQYTHTFLLINDQTFLF